MAGFSFWVCAGAWADPAVNTMDYPAWRTRLRQLLTSTNQLRFVPLNRLPVGVHLGLAATCILLLGAIACGVLMQATRQLHAVEQRHALLAEELKAASSKAQPIPTPNFVDTLPSALKTDDVVRDIGLAAQKAGVLITSMGIEPRASTPTQLGSVQFNVAASAPYKASKEWLSDLLGRYSSLAINALSLQPMANDPTQQDVHLILVWYVKD